MTAQFPYTNRMPPTDDMSKFTADQLAFDYAGDHAAILWHNLHKGVNWKPADPSGEPKKKCCKGKIKRMGVALDSDIYFVLEQINCPGLLNAGNYEEDSAGELECELPWEDRKPMRGALLRVKKGGWVKICGWWTTDLAHGGPTGKNEIHDITSIEDLPDP